jgi:hypothetical protein
VAPYRPPSLTIVPVAEWLHSVAAAMGDWSAGLTAPQATLLTGAAVLVVGTSTILQKFRNDKRDQWWKRAQWAIDLALDEDNLRQATGFAAITHLASRSEATSGDRQLLWEVVIAQQALELESQDPDTEQAGIDTDTADVQDGEPEGGTHDGVS